MWVIIRMLYKGNYTYLIPNLYHSMKKFAVIGNPVSHSLSPVIHQHFADQFNINLDYGKILAEEGEFDRKIDEFIERGGVGLNVTLPYKTDAFRVSRQLSDRAELAKTVNTLSFKEGHIAGDNTDGIGLIADLQSNQELNLDNKRILILGAGGAVAGVLGPILECHPQLIVIANRTVNKAVALEKQFSKFGPVKACGLTRVDESHFDLVINGTAASLSNQRPQVNTRVLEGVQFAYDMMYAIKPTLFMDWARQNGVMNTANGLGMLVEQAAASFHIWHGRQPDTEPVLKKVKAAMFTTN